MLTAPHNAAEIETYIVQMLEELATLADSANDSGLAGRLRRLAVSAADHKDQDGKKGSVG